MVLEALRSNPPLTHSRPTPAGAAVKPDGPDDYASKHWSGLIKDYYRARAIGFLDQALLDAAQGKALDTKATDQMMATLAYNFQLNSFDVVYPTEPVEDAVTISAVMREKYAPWYAPACGA